MPRVYFPFEQPSRGFIPHIGGILPGTPSPNIVGAPQLRGGPFVGLPGAGLECAEAVTNMLVDPQFSVLTNWPAWATPTTREIGSRFAMDQGAFFGGLHIASDAADEGAYQNVTLVNATAYTGSVWAYVLSGAVQLYIDKGAGAETVSSTKVRQWERLVKSFTSDGTAGGLYLGTVDAAAEGYFWMPQLATGTYAKPARVGVQAASCIYVPSPIAETQTPWSVVCVVTPDWDHDGDGSTGARRVWDLWEDDNNEVSLWYESTADKWDFSSRVASALTQLVGAVQTFHRGDKIHLAATCNGYNGYLYVNGVKSGPLVMGSVQPTVLAIGAWSAAGGNSLNGVVDDFAFLEGCALPEWKVQELYRAFLRGIPLHGLTGDLEV